MSYMTCDLTGFETLLVIKEDGSWVSIPIDPANTDYQQYLAWLEEGNVPEEWNQEEVVEDAYPKPEALEPEAG